MVSSMSSHLDENVAGESTVSEEGYSANERRGLEGRGSTLVEDPSKLPKRAEVTTVTITWAVTVDAYSCALCVASCGLPLTTPSSSSADSSQCLSLSALLRRLPG